DHRAVTEFPNNRRILTASLGACPPMSLLKYAKTSTPRAAAPSASSTSAQDDLGWDRNSEQPIRAAAKMAVVERARGSVRLIELSSGCPRSRFEQHREFVRGFNDLEYRLGSVGQGPDPGWIRAGDDHRTVFEPRQPAQVQEQLPVTLVRRRDVINDHLWSMQSQERIKVHITISNRVGECTDHDEPGVLERDTEHVDHVRTRVNESDDDRRLFGGNSHLGIASQNEANLLSL
ncbi:MAG: hypothetical protein M3541_14255, partial [Acidobacteriota bacterium]|nr:hypothetical protein [Acidobacteriota bacterium]